MSGLSDRLLLIDESDDIVHGGRKYVVACAVVLLATPRLSVCACPMCSLRIRIGLGLFTGRPRGPSCGRR